MSTRNGSGRTPFRSATSVELLVRLLAESKVRLRMDTSDHSNSAYPVQAGKIILCRGTSTISWYLYMRESLSPLTPQKSLQHSPCQRVCSAECFYSSAIGIGLAKQCMRLCLWKCIPKPCQQAQANCVSFVTAHATVLLLQRTQPLLQHLIAMRTYYMASFMQMALGIWPE